MAYRSDEQLIRRCLDGEQAAWDELVERYGRLVWSVPRRYGLSEADAADVVQNVFTAAFRRLETLRDQTRLSSWLITTAHREAWRVGKRSGNGGRLDEMVEDVGAPRDDEVTRWERQDMVNRALEELGDPCRSLLNALFLEPTEASYEVIAERLGMKIGSIGPTRARCFRKLEEVLAGMGFDAEQL